MVTCEALDEGLNVPSIDLAIISARLINEFPEYYPYFAQREFTYDGITQPNRNPLLKLGLGADGYILAIISMQKLLENENR